MSVQWRIRFPAAELDPDLVTRVYREPVPSLSHLSRMGIARAHCTLLIAHRSSLIAHRSSLIAHANRS
jgi:hypothetical protein